jgi:outer membrane protein insertion porin family
MKSSRSRLLWVLAVCSALSLSAQTDSKVQQIEIRHVGPPAVSEQMARANIRVKVGDPFNKANTDQDIRTLRATGYFYNIRVLSEVEGDGVKLIYVLQGKPVLTEIRFEGNKKYKREKLLKKLTSKVGDPLDEYKLFNDAREVRKMYEKAGRQKTTVEYRPVITEATGKASVTFVVQEAPKVRLAHVNFPDAAVFKQSKLRKVFKKTRGHWMFSWLTGSGKLKDDEFEDDKEKLLEFYQGKGYIDFEIKDVQFDYPKPNRLNLNVKVFEGKPYKTGAIAFQGNQLFSINEIFSIHRGLTGGKPFQLTPGKVFTPEGLNKDREAIQNVYWARGHVDVIVAPIKNANTETGTMDVTYRIEEGEKSYVEKIEIKGNVNTKDKVIRRELAVAPGEVFNMVRVNASKSILEQMGYFSKVEADREPTEVPNRKNLVIGLTEKETGHFDIGAGFSSIDSLFGIVGFTQGNFDLFNPPWFTGGGQKLRVYATIGTRRKDYILSFSEPWFLGRRLRLDVDLFHRELNYLSSIYNEQDTGARVGLAKSITRNLTAGVSYTIESIGIVDVDSGAPKFIKQEEGHWMVSKPGVSLAYDTRNRVDLPNRGQRTELTFEVGGGPFGGDTDFYKWELSSGWYFKGFLEGHVLEVGGRVGVVDKFGDSDRVHLWDRWFLGGANTLRGYRYRKVGPKEDGEPIGGDSFWFASAEYSVPIIERLRLAVFYDIGSVYLNAYDFDPGKYSDNWGVGVRLNIPMLGPLRLDYGIPITHDKDVSGSGKFQFNVGTSRSF